MEEGKDLPWTSFNNEDRDIGILSETTGHSVASCTTTHDDEVVFLGELVGHCNDLGCLV
jgi:hypothetical protein